MADDPTPNTSPFTRHDRQWRDFRYVYPVVSRRSGGLSIGINLNPDQQCNFDCIYCQVDRSAGAPEPGVDLEVIRRELAWMVQHATGGAIWTEPGFCDVPPTLRRINDIAFSGDGEPTLCSQFDRACEIAAEVKTEAALAQTKLAVLTNATRLDHEMVQRGLAVLDRHNGEIWAKLDAGSAEYYRQIDRGNVPFERIVNNITRAGQTRSIVIQSMFVLLHGQPIPPDQFTAYLDRLEEMVTGGCRVRLVQLYTVARRTAEPYVQPLPNNHLDKLAERLRQRLPKLTCQVYYGVS